MSSFLKRKYLIAYNGYDSGLGNRVRVVLGAKSLAQLEDRRLYYVWPTGELFGPKFSDLWAFSGRTMPRAVSRGLARVFPYEDETLDWLDTAKRRERVWQIRTGSPLNLPRDARPWQDEFRLLTPVDEIADKVITIFDRSLRDASYVGVMIRAHSVSHTKTRETSPVDWFVRRMRQIREAAPDVRFFVSCDVQEVQEMVMRELGGCVAQVDKGGYNTVDGVRSAVADLYLLASSGYILGPHWSSFVHLAEYLSGGKVHMETAAQAGSGPLDYTSSGRVPNPLKPFDRA